MERKKQGPPALEPAKALLRAYGRRYGIHGVVTDARGTILAGRLGCGPCLDKVCIPLRCRIVTESLRWGTPFTDLCPRGAMMWGVPMILNQRVVGGLIASVPMRGRPSMKRLRTAADGLLAMAIDGNLTNAYWLGQHRAKAEQERQKAEAIHDAKLGDYDHIRAVYLQEEPALIAAIRKGERGVARGILNRILVGIYFVGRDRIDLLKSLVMELVVMMSRAAVEAGAAPSDILGGHFRGLAELAAIRDDEALTHWLATMLERLMEAIHDHRRYPNTVLLRRAIRHMQDHLAEDLTRDQVARIAGLSPSHFSHLIRSQIHSTYSSLLNEYRVNRAAQMLVRTTKAIAEIAQASGFSDQSYFTKVFKRRTGLTPRAYRLQPR